MISLSLDQISSVVSGDLFLSSTADSADLVAGEVDTDSRKIGPGGIFVAKPGAASDGFLFIQDAVTAGASLVITQRLSDVDVSQIVVPDVIQALADLAKFVVATVKERADLTVIGITGSNGKTTTKNMLARILSTQAETIWPIASFNNEVGAPLTMLRVSFETRYLVCEFGASGPGEILRLASLVTPDLSIVLMVGKAHAGGFGGLEVTAAAKSELILATKPGGVAVLNADDPRVLQMSELAAERGIQVIYFGRSAQQARASFFISEVSVSQSGTEAVVETVDSEISLSLQVIGEHHVMNAVAAIAAADALGVPVSLAVDVLSGMPLAERWRMQLLGNADVLVINDAYNASPDSMSAALRTLAQITQPNERTVAVLGSMSELGESDQDEHIQLALLAVRLGIQRIVVVGEAARVLYLAAISEGSWDGEAVFFADSDSAFEYLKTELRAGDRVLVKSSNAAGLRYLGDRVGELFT